MIDDVRKLIARWQRKIALMVVRGVVQLVDDGHGIQQLQLVVQLGDLRNGAQRFQEYGFTSVPFPGAEAVSVSLGGLRSQGIIIAVDDRRYRLQGLQGGEVALYDDQGQTIYIRRGGIDVEAKGKLRLCGDTVEIVARTTLRQDVGGYASEMIAEGGNTWQQNTWQQGAIVNTTPNPVAPPEKFGAF